jgi:RNA polymerase sigma-70 factor, ECF subfamily
LEEFLLDDYTIEDKGELIEALMSQYGNDILKLSFSYVRNHAVAEELTQEIFIKTYERIDTYQHKSSIKTWLWRIAINHCKDYLRSWNYRKVVISEQLSKDTVTQKETVEAEVIQRDEDDILAHEVLNLPVKYREVIYLHYFVDLPIKEIESITGVNQNTIKTRLKRAKEILKNKLEERL